MSEYVEYLKEVFCEFGSIQPRRMFGGYGIFYKGLMFGLVADDMLYLKADQINAHFFTERELEQFSYEKRGQVLKCPTTWPLRIFSMILKKRRCGPSAPLLQPVVQVNPRKRSNDLMKIFY